MADKLRTREQIEFDERLKAVQRKVGCQPTGLPSDNYVELEQRLEERLAKIRRQLNGAT